MLKEEREKSLMTGQSFKQRHNQVNSATALRYKQEKVNFAHPGFPAVLCKETVHHSWDDELQIPGRMMIFNLDLRRKKAHNGER